MNQIYQVNYVLKSGVTASVATNSEHQGLFDLVYTTDLESVLSKVSALNLQYWVVSAVVLTPHKILQ